MGRAHVRDGVALRGTRGDRPGSPSTRRRQPRFLFVRRVVLLSARGGYQSWPRRRENSSAKRQRRGVEASTRLIDASSHPWRCVSGVATSSNASPRLCPARRRSIVHITARQRRASASNVNGVHRGRRQRAPSSAFLVVPMDRPNIALAPSRCAQLRGSVLPFGFHFLLRPRPGDGVSSAAERVVATGNVPPEGAAHAADASTDGVLVGVGTAR